MVDYYSSEMAFKFFRVSKKRWMEELCQGHTISLAHRHPLQSMF